MGLSFRDLKAGDVVFLRHPMKSGGRLEIAQVEHVERSINPKVQMVDSILVRGYPRRFDRLTGAELGVSDRDRAQLVDVTDLGAHDDFEQQQIVDQFRVEMRTLEARSQYRASEVTDIAKHLEQRAEWLSRHVFVLLSLANRLRGHERRSTLRKHTGESPSGT